MQSPNRKLRNVLVAVLSLLLLFSSIPAFAADVPSPTEVYFSEAEKNTEFPSYTKPSDDRIREVQIQLRSRGYLSDVTGVLDPGTSNAIKKFQIDHNLEPTGEVDSATADLLGITLNPKEQFFYAINLDELAKTTDKEYLCYVSLRSRTITLFHHESDGSWRRVGTDKIKKTNLCSIGKDDSMTPAGIYQVTNNSQEKVEEDGLEYYFPTLFGISKMISSVPHDASSDKWLSETLGTTETDGDIWTEKDVAEFIQKRCVTGTYIAIDDRAYNPVN